MNYKGLNEEHIKWHLMEIYKPERFNANLNSVYTMPKRINYMSIAEGKNFDALLIDDKMFRFTKLNESDKDLIQDYINKYAYATALVKLNECSNVIGCGLNYNYSTDEAYDFVSKSYDKLFENYYITKEMGRLCESFSDDKLKVFEGNKRYIRSVGTNKLVEDWENDFNHKLVKNYYIESVNSKDNDTTITFVDNFGKMYEAHYMNTDSKLLEFGVNPERYLKRNNLIESFRIGTLTEYQKPFTLHYAVITSYNKDDNGISIGVLDAFGNSGTLNLSLNIPVEEFDKKYGKEIKNIVNASSFGERLDLTTDFFAKAKDDIASVGRIKGRQISERNKENQLLSYKIYDFIPYAGNGDIVSRGKSKEKFLVHTIDSNNKEYNISYLYTGTEPISEFIDAMNVEADDYDFSKKSDVVSFYQILDDYGDILGSYPTGISTKERNYPKKEGEEMNESILNMNDDNFENKVIEDFDAYLDSINVSQEDVREEDINDYFTSMFYEIWDNDDLDSANKAEKIIRKKYHLEDNFNESEGVQTTDIAPKVDQDLGLVKVKMKKRGKLTESLKSDLLIDMISEKDAFYGARGFIKDEYGRYHFNDYYLTESGKVVHKSKLNESYGRQTYEPSNIYYISSNEYGIIKSNDEDSDILEIYIGDNKYDEETIPKNLSEDKIRELISKVSKSNLNESEETADDAYYKTNDVQLKLQELKQYVEGNEEAEKLYNNIFIELNQLQMLLHKSKLHEEFWNDEGETEYKGVKISIEKSDKGKKCYIPLRNDNFKPENGVQFFTLKDVKDYIDSKSVKSE